MIGAMLAMRNASIGSPRDRVRRSVFLDRLDQVFDLGFDGMTWAACGSGISPRMTAMRLISSDIACTSRNAKPIMISNFAGHAATAGIADCSLISNEPRKTARR